MLRQPRSCHIPVTMYAMPWRTAATLFFGLSCAVLLFTFPMAAILPPWWSHENQPIENAQVFVLAIGFFAALLFFHRSADPARWFGLCAALILAVLIGRELSWGAVFFDPTSVGDHGPLFASRYLWYKPAVAPAVAALLIASITIIVVKRLAFLGFALLRQRRIPFFSLLLTAIGMLVSTAAEGHLPLVPLPSFIDGNTAQLIEEISELAAYLAMIGGLFFIFSDLEMQETGGAGLR